MLCFFIVLFFECVGCQWQLLFLISHDAVLYIFHDYMDEKTSVSIPKYPRACFTLPRYMKYEEPIHP